MLVDPNAVLPNAGVALLPNPNGELVCLTPLVDGGPNPAVDGAVLGASNAKENFGAFVAPVDTWADEADWDVDG